MIYTFKEYQHAAYSCATYPNMGSNLIYPVLGLTGEAGETADKIKKISRNRNILTPSLSDLTEEERLAIIKEIGDVLWYISALSYELGTTLEEVATININKLFDRRDRNVIKGEGDNR
jgi:NTP pyrophosphatase (non-canonical NTP hydrolase)